MKTVKIIILCTILSIVLAGCMNEREENHSSQAMEWKMQLQEQLSEFGHRNWILLVDKAFPSQNAEGIITLNTGENLLDVLSYTLKEIEGSTHVKPIVYTDKELRFMTEELAAGITDYSSSLDQVIGKYNPEVLLHDSVFVKIDQASKLFKVLILKTEGVIAYSSVFIELDCKYWSAEKEKNLRESMQ